MSTPAQRSFSGGELTPRLWPRTDAAKYAVSLRTCRNSVVKKEGGTESRGGTQFIAEVKDSAKHVRIIPFVYSSTQTYFLEFGDFYLRFHFEGAQVTEAALAITAITKANPAVVTIAAHGLTNGEEVAIAGASGMTQVNGRNFKVAVIDANNFSLQYMDGTAVNSTSFTTYTSGGTAARVYTVTTQFAEAHLPAMTYDQTGGTLTVAHPSVQTRDITRVSHTNWLVSALSFGPSIAAPTNVTTPGPAAGTNFFVTTAVSATGEESLASASVDAKASGASSVQLDDVTGAVLYRLYKQVLSSTYAFFKDGRAAGQENPISFFVIADTASGDVDYSRSPPAGTNPINGSNNWPAAIGYYQQRALFGGANNFPETVKASRTGSLRNFDARYPLQADDPISFTPIGRVYRVRHFLDLSLLFIMCEGGEFIVKGDQAGVLTPSSVNVVAISRYGSGNLRPLVVDSVPLIVQARQNIVRELSLDPQTSDPTQGDRSLFGSHLFEGYTISDWAYQQTPGSVVWAVRSDGTLLGMTYVREQQIWGWHRHDTDGTFENIATGSETAGEVAYVVVKRTIGGVTKRYIERMNPRYASDARDLKLVDCGLSFDGRNATATTMTLSGGVAWTDGELLTCTASASFFAAGDVGNGVFLTGSDGSFMRFRIASFSSATVVQGYADRTVPAVLRSAAVTTWSKALKNITGLWHLEGKRVSVQGDASVVGSPNNSEYPVYTVTSGSLVLDQPYAVIHVGLPFTADIETLELDTPNGNSLTATKKLINAVTVHLENSRGGFVGPGAPTGSDPLLNLTEMKVRRDEDYDATVAAVTGKQTTVINSSWSDFGRVFIRQVDPLPISVLAIVPDVMTSAGG